jgi:hypothetical protein
VAKLDFVNLVAAFGGTGSSEQSQPANHSLLAQPAVPIGDAVMVNLAARVRGHLPAPVAVRAGPPADVAGIAPVLSRLAFTCDRIAVRETLSSTARTTPR